MAEDSFDKKFPSLKGKNGVLVSEQEFMITSADIFSTLEGLSLAYDVCIPSRLIKEHCLDKAKVKEAILRNFIDDKFRRQLLNELGLE